VIPHTSQTIFSHTSPTLLPHSSHTGYYPDLIPTPHLQIIDNPNFFIITKLKMPHQNEIAVAAAVSSTGRRNTTKSLCK
jgi:hypothetical protein